MNVNAVRQRVVFWVFMKVRWIYFVLGDVVLLALSAAAAVWLRFDGRIPPQVWQQLPLVVGLSLLARLPAFASQGMYVVSWAQVGLDEMMAVVRGVTLGSLVFWALAFVMKQTPWLTGFSRGALLIEYFLTLHAIGAFRIGYRVYAHYRNRIRRIGRAALIVGAGAAGEQLARSLRQTPQSGYTPVGYIDDDPAKTGTFVHGLRVLGDRNRLPDMARTHGVEAVLIAMPSAPSREMRNVVALARQAGIREIRIVPGLEHLLNGEVSFTDLRDVQLPDLLGREVVRIDTRAVEAWVQDRCVLVTGAGGSIGAELCRQLVRFRPSHLAILDWDESGLFWVEQELQRARWRGATVVADVREADRVRHVLQTLQPHIVFHAAAYKHVGLMERHPEDAVITNVVGTRTVAEASLAIGVERFVLISTDKAVNPTSVMGATKRVAEEVCLALNSRGATRFSAVRFGNVLGSRGSVVPLFHDNIRRGEPLQIRGRNMRRYFMATSEAVLLVLQAGVMGEGGEVFVLDMGEPIRIVDLAREMIRLAGLEPDQDVPIVFTDPEPGEKEHEDLLTAEEGTLATRHDRIFVAQREQRVSADELMDSVGRLERAARARDTTTLIKVLGEIVPTYQPSEAVRALVAPPR